ncbi:hypothetical protein ES754_05605 [Psychrobacter frigidicola]|uniref:Uncharacterized protein n=1 Tax=Psychrobacter frigidicola TaxID=45611 RepID=A0A5C7A780_9GAMM|nr:hypothetical protein [Psychrobacter frigidicola]TXD98394.1 hypothetical protein ES754_05605 [Psychrobacter frigidicola]
MSNSKDMNSGHEDSNKTYKLRDAADNKGVVPDDALQKVNPAAAERATPDHDLHNVAKDHKQYDSADMKK